MGFVIKFLSVVEFDFMCDLNWGIFVAWFSCCQEMCFRFRWFLFSLMESNLLKS